MLKRWLVLLLTLVLAAPQPGFAADALDTDLAAGVRQAQEGDFEGAVVTLDSVVRRLSGQPSRAKDLARAYTYLSIAYQGLAQEQQAKAKFLEALKLDGEMTLSSREFPPRILEFFEKTRREANLPAPPAPQASPSPAARPRAMATPEPERKKGSKTVPILIGAALLGGVGVAVAAGGGGGNGPNPTPAPPAGPLSFRLTWASQVDLDLHVREPNGNEINYINTTSSTGGSLDRDVFCQPGTETTSWPPGAAPRGTYVVWIVHSITPCGGPNAASYTLTISQGNSVVMTRTGTLTYNTESERFSFVN